MDHLKRLKEYKITERLLVCEGDNFFVQDPKCYRWLPKEIFKTGVMSLLYGNKLAIQFWNNSVCVIIENKNVYNEEKQRFEYLWDNALIPPETKTTR